MIINDVTHIRISTGKAIAGFVIASSLLFVTPTVFAARYYAAGTGASGAVGANESTRISNLQGRAATAINNRVSNLNNLISRINGIRRLTTDQKNSLTSGVQSEITSLQNLLSKIQADTDLATLKTDVQSIVQSFRVYVLYIPMTDIIAHADRLMDVVSLLQTYEGKLQTRVTNAGNPSNLTALLTDMTAKLTDANTQATNAINAVMPLTPAGWPGNKSTLQSARSMLQTARNDIQTVWNDAGQIRRGLPKNTVTPTTTVAPTATPTATPTP